MSERGQATSAALEAAPDAVVLPSHISMREHMGALELTFHRSSLRRPVAIVGAALTLFLGGFAWALAGGPIGGASGAALAAIVGVPYAVYAYVAAAAYINRTTLTVTPGHLRFAVGPLPFLAPRDVAGRDIAQLTSRHAPSGWSVFWRDREGAERLLLAGLNDETQAKQLERLIEDRLRIVDDAQNKSAMPAGAEPVPWSEATSSESEREREPARAEAEAVGASRGR